MKYLITLLWISFCASSYAQSDIKEMIIAYEDYCNEIVQDTVKQYGLIEKSFVKIEGSGTYQIKMDTTWNQVPCPDYKYNSLSFGCWDISDASIISDFSSDFYYSDNAAYTHQLNFVKGSEKSDKELIKVSRDYICDCKRRNIIPFSDDFWDWVKNKS